MSNVLGKKDKPISIDLTLSERKEPVVGIMKIMQEAKTVLPDSSIINESRVKPGNNVKYGGRSYNMVPSMDSSLPKNIRYPPRLRRMVAVNVDNFPTKRNQVPDDHHKEIVVTSPYFNPEKSTKTFSQTYEATRTKISTLCRNNSESHSRTGANQADSSSHPFSSSATSGSNFGDINLGLEDNNTTFTNSKPSHNVEGPKLSTEDFFIPVTTNSGRKKRKVNDDEVSSHEVVLGTLNGKINHNF